MFVGLGWDRFKVAQVVLVVLVLCLYVVHIRGDAPLMHFTVLGQVSRATATKTPVVPRIGCGPASRRIEPLTPPCRTGPSPSMEAEAPNPTSDPLVGFGLKRAHDPTRWYLVLGTHVALLVIHKLNRVSVQD